MDDRRVVIAGGSGFVGQAAAQLLIKLGYDVVILTRGSVPNFGRGVNWDANTVGPWHSELDGAKAVINLTGKEIACKWTAEAKTEIVNSRVLSTRAIGEAIAKCANPPGVWINGSAVGYYGDRGAQELTESAEPGAKKLFLVDTAVAWEAALDRAEIPASVRRIKLRTGIVLGDRGALPALVKLTKMFLGGHAGSGRQFVPWIHIDDMARVIVFCIEHEVAGPVNACAPLPCSNEFLMASLRAIVGRPWSPGVPVFILKIAAFFGAPDPSMILSSCRSVPKKLKEGGFTFIHEDLRAALMDLVNPAN